MKTHLLLGALLCSHVFAAGEGFTNFVRQTQQGTGVVWNMPVSPTGSSASQLLLESGGSLFQLWTIEQATAAEYLLDQKVVGAYLPKADIVITTVDPNRDPVTGAPRTRADKPFTVKTTVSGLLSGINLPTAATKVLWEQHLASFSGNVNSITPAQATSGTPKTSTYLTANGTTTVSAGATSLPPVNGIASKAKGQEHFVVHALADGALSQSQIASAYVQVWPTSSGEIIGVTDNQRVRSKPPTLTIKAKDLYPESRTYLQVYEGGQMLGTKGTLMSRELDYPNTQNISVSPQDFTIEDYDQYFKKDGTYTIELITETAFDSTRLDWVTFVLDRNLEIRAQITGIDVE
jgi:hypothetical protein